MPMTEVDAAVWVRDQTCRPLDSETEVNIAKIQMAINGLPLHNDRWKNWDNFLALTHVTRLIEYDEPVLDAGACRDPSSPSVFLPGLKLLGFTNLTGCNLDEGEPQTVDGINYQHCDIEQPHYADRSFSFVGCFSVLEHGIEWHKYFTEMARIIRPGGFLFTSFDYWSDPIDAKGQQAFGAPVKIFTAEEVTEMVAFAESVQLNLTNPLTLACRKAPVEWLGMRYTFLNLLMLHRGSD